MINKIVYEDEIKLWWDRLERNGESYRVRVGDTETLTEKTHAEFTSLEPDTEYSCSVYLGERLLEELLIKTPKKKRKIDVTLAPYFAKGDGKTLNTAALQKALDDCGAGEAVYLPKGVYLTGSLRMHSNTELFVDKGAVLQGTDRVEDYSPKIKSRFEGIEMMCYAALINIGELCREGGVSCENVVLRGGGSIFGGGRSLAVNVIELERELQKEYIKSLGDAVLECENGNTIPGRPRPRLINMSNARGVVISDLSVGYGASWNLHMIYSSDIVTCGCSFYSKDVWNGDGWDPDSSEDCTIYDCEFRTGDDSVAIKSGKNPEGNIVNKPTRRIRVFDCRSISGHGITVGSEMSGGVEDVYIWDCDMERSVYGVEIKGTRKRGGYVRRVFVNDSIMPRVLMHSVGYNDDGIAAPTVPVFSDCVFENLVLTGRAEDNKTGEPIECDTINLIGFDNGDHALSNIVFKNITLDQTHRQKHNISVSCCNGLTLENIIAK